MLLCSTLIQYVHQLRAAGSDLQITFKQEGSQVPLQRLGLVQPVYISSVVSAMYVVISVSSLAEELLAFVLKISVFPHPSEISVLWAFST